MFIEGYLLFTKMTYNFDDHLEPSFKLKYRAFDGDGVDMFDLESDVITTSADNGSI